MLDSLRASFGMETATNTMRRQEVRYSSSVSPWNTRVIKNTSNDPMSSPGPKCRHPFINTSSKFNFFSSTCGWKSTRHIKIIFTHFRTIFFKEDDDICGGWRYFLFLVQSCTQCNSGLTIKTMTTFSPCHTNDKESRKRENTKGHTETSIDNPNPELMTLGLNCGLDWYSDRAPALGPTNQNIRKSSGTPLLYKKGPIFLYFDSSFSCFLIRFDPNLDFWQLSNLDGGTRFCCAIPWEFAWA